MDAPQLDYCDMLAAQMAKRMESAEEEIEAMRWLARDAFDAWNHDKDAKLGKLLRAMIDHEFRKVYRPEMYRPDLVPNAEVTGA
jgi:hypothetical protein